MTDPTKVSDLNPPPNSVPADDPTKQGNVAYTTYQRVLKEAKDAKEKLRILEEEKANASETKLKEQNEWKTLYEQRNEELTKTKSTLQEQEVAIENGVKYHAFEKALGGKLKKREYSTFVDFKKILINPETKEVDTDSVKSVVADFLKEHAELVQYPGGARLPNQAGAGAGKLGPAKKLSDMTQEEIMDKAVKMAAAGTLK